MSDRSDGAGGAGLPETILQFGAGNFLRAFADLFVHEANEAGRGVGRIVAVQSTASGRAARLNAQGARYHVAIRGVWGGEMVDRAHQVTSISRALVATEQWGEVIAVARSPHLRFVISNVTEAGYALSPDDATPQNPPRSFPAKLAAVLIERHRARQSPIIVLPCELREDNATALRDLVLAQARTWGVSSAELYFIEHDCRWLNTLVDRIVPGTPREHPLLADDPLLIVAEPFALWAVESDDPDVLGPLHHPAIAVRPDIRPFTLRKVRILNGGHTALVCKAMPLGIETVREAVLDDRIGAWLRELLFEEIVPVLEGRVERPADFARDVLDRFRNPALHHRLADIALHHESKVAVRLVPTYHEFVERFGKAPPRLGEVLASHLTR